MNVTIGGEIPRSYVRAKKPIFNSSGQRYIVVQNPNANLLESLLIYDWINSPRYYNYNYGYNSRLSSPYYYGLGEAGLIRENITITVSSWSKASFNDQLTLQAESMKPSELHSSDRFITEVVSDVTTSSSEAEYVRVESEPAVQGDAGWTDSSGVQDSAPAYEAPSYSIDLPSTSFE